jgi:pyridoxal phosphate enzyme (YggS family)
VAQDVLVQVNVAREDQKDGSAPEETSGLVAHVLAQPHLRLRGMMAMAPFTDDAAVQRATFKGLRELRDRLASVVGKDTLGELSMGMSSDFEIAVEEGATLLRLGTILFGERKP